MTGSVGILAPSGRDASVIADILARAGIGSVIRDDVAGLLGDVGDRTTGAVVIAQEALTPTALSKARAFLEAQPAWSDLPTVLLTWRGGGGPQQSEAALVLGNVTVLERPFAPSTLLSAARTALRARARQHEAERQILELAQRERDLIEERARLEISQARLKEANDKLDRRFAEALAEKQVLADIVGGTDAFVQVADLQYRWLAINRASADEFERIFGVRPQVGMSMLDAISHMPEHRRAVQEVWGRALSGEEFTEIGEFGDAGRDPRFYEMRFNVLRDASGERIGAYQFVYDVTERLRDQEKLAEAQARMHEMAKLETLGQLTGGVAHDFNNLLTPITGALDMLLRREDQDPRSARLVQGALEAAERAAVLVQRLLTFARRQHLEARAIDVGELVVGIQDLVQRSIGSHIVVDVTVEDNLPAARIDPNQLELAVLNLAVNAADAMPGGGSLRIDVSERVLADGVVGDLGAGAFVRLAVTDTGSGMDEATMRRAIEPFYTTKGIGKGTGLGLSMVHGLAAQSGGALALKSSPGKGTTAEIWLPVSQRAADPLTVPVGEPIRPQRRATILVVDDEDLVRRATAEMLREMGHEVLEASSGITALDTLRQRPEIELLVSDYLMPGMRGSELIRKAKRVRPGLRGLLITGYAQSSQEGAELTRLAKPFRAVDLAREISRILSDEVVDLSAHRLRAAASDSEGN